MDKKIEWALDSILVPGANRSPVQLNLVKSVERNDGLVRVVLGDAALTGEAKQSLEESVRVAVAAVTGDDATVVFIAAKPEEVNEIRHTVALMSGKGGVGKSLVTGLLALSSGAVATASASWMRT